MCDSRDVYVSAIFLIETIYLLEKQSLPVTALQRPRSALHDPESGLRISSVDAGVTDALQNIFRDAVPDMPDRLIVATAAHFGVPLITRDRRIQSAGIETTW